MFHYLFISEKPSLKICRSAQKPNSTPNTGLLDIPSLESLNSPVLNIIAGVLLISVAGGASCVYSAIYRMMAGRNLSVWQPMRESVD